MAIVKEPDLVFGSDPYLITSESCLVVVVFTSWVAFELLMQLIYWGLWPGGHSMVVHHGTACIAWGLFWQGGYGHGLQMFGVLCELTNPFMSFRYFISAMNLKESRLYIANGMCFLVSWILVRILLCPIGGTMLIWRQREPISELPLWRAIIMVGFFGLGTVLQLMWGRKIIMGAVSILTSKGHPKEA